MKSEKPPFVIYDGDCGFCKRCVNWLERHAHRPVRVAAYQECTEFPDISPEKFKAGVGYRTVSCHLCFGGEAVVTSLEEIADIRWPAKWYRKSAVFRWITEKGYEWVAGHRPLMSRILRR